VHLPRDSYSLQRTLRFENKHPQYNMRSKNTRPVHTSKTIFELRGNMPHSLYLQLPLRIVPNDDRDGASLVGSLDISTQNMANGTQIQSHSMAEFKESTNEFNRLITRHLTVDAPMKA
jgi:hypothetical protein